MGEREECKKELERFQNTSFSECGFKKVISYKNYSDVSQTLLFTDINKNMIDIKIIQMAIKYEQR